MTAESRKARVRIPADEDRDDRLLAGPCARQLAILGGSGVVVWLGSQATRTVLPLPVFVGLAAPVAAAAAVLGPSPERSAAPTSQPCNL